MKIVHLKWFDPAFSRDGWMDKPTFKEFLSRGLSKAESIGMLAHETETSYTLLMTVGDNQVGDAITIAKANVESIREIGDVGISLDL